VFHEEERPTYGEAVRAQLDRAVERLGPGDLGALLHGGDTWTVG
jgi:2-oxoglutarate ferredoxin oxidoreductase subunit beta